MRHRAQHRHRASHPAVARPGRDAVLDQPGRAETEQVPEALIVLGGGAVGAELSQMFGRFGSRVTVLESATLLLPTEEPEAGQLLAAVFGREQITVRTNVRAVGVHPRDHVPGRGSSR
jgi:pyruvate/2-oxoglutarate dehydrogenase complex dihydrolipoamide dehydrogenase (E3) component